MESGKLYVRSRGTDIWSAEITGVGSPSEITTLKNFHANHVKDTFTFEDKTQSPTINRTCVFLSNLRVNYLGNARYEWRCLIAETTTA